MKDYENAADSTENDAETVAKQGGLNRLQIDPGQASARNTVIEIATGEFITFVDDDDWIDPAILLYR